MGVHAAEPTASTYLLSLQNGLNKGILDSAVAQENTSSLSKETLW